MAHRRITDSQNQVWDVWEVIPSRVEQQPPDPANGPRNSNPGRRIVVPLELQAGWLAFQCGETRRRIAPLPPGWSELSDAALLNLMATAPSLPIRASRT